MLHAAMIQSAVNQKLPEASTQFITLRAPVNRQVRRLTKNKRYAVEVGEESKPTAFNNKENQRSTKGYKIRNVGWPHKATTSYINEHNPRVTYSGKEAKAMTTAI